MKSRIIKGKQSPSTSTPSVSHTSVPANPDHQTASIAPDLKGKRTTRRIIRSPETMFSDPVDEDLSDAASFDEYDMCGSDSGGEIISLRDISKEPEQSPEFLEECDFALAFERLEMDIHDISIMVKELADSEGIVVPSSPIETQDEVSHIQSTSKASDMLLELDGEHMDIDV